MDVELWAGTIGTIADALIEQQPACEGTVRNNAEHYRQQLTALDGWIREAIGTIPEDHRYLVTAHDAFGYYGRSYDIQVVGIQGISTASAAGVGDIRATAAKIVDTGVPAIFIESTINPRTIQSVVEAAQQRGHQVEVGGELYSDAMGAQGTAEGTYIGMLHANTRTVVTALGGQTPPLPAALEDWAKEWGL
jgi:manganese/zinc/iron transport system substrate-binding protein